MRMYGSRPGLEQARGEIVRRRWLCGFVQPRNVPRHVVFMGPAGWAEP